MSNSFNKKSKRGFTLTEMLVIILIITIIASVATPIYKKVVLKARAAEAINLLMLVRTKQAQNYARKNSYFKTFGEMSGNLTGSSEVRDANNSSLLKVDNYEVELSGENDCVVASYKPANSDTEEFSFSISYLRNGLGCDGEICSSFGDVIGDVETVCQRPLEVESKCPNFNPRNCSYPYVVSSEGCSCECSDAARIACSNKQDSTWYEDSCYCDFPCEPTDHPEIGNNNWFWDADGCEWACGITEANCGERESYNSSTCKCDCLYGTDSNGNCACPSGQIWDGAHCSGCAYQSYTLPDGSSVCCTEEAPLVIEGECAACPPKSQWNPDTKICECENVVNGVCQCPNDRPMWTGLECVADNCEYQSGVTSEGLYLCCTNGDYPMIRGEQCVACPENSTWDSSTKQCVCGAGVGYIPEYEEGTLIACGCPTGSKTSYYGPAIAEGSTCKCPRQSSTTGSGNPTISGSVCKCMDLSMTFSPANSSCLCPTYSALHGNACECVRTFQENRDENGVLISCTCPAGTSQDYTGPEITYNPVNFGFTSKPCRCPENHIWQNNQCVNLDGICPTGTSIAYTGPVGQTIEGGYQCRCPGSSSTSGIGILTQEGSVCRCVDLAMSWSNSRSACACLGGDGAAEYNARRNICECCRSYQENRNQNGVLISCSCPVGTSVAYKGGIVTYNSESSCITTYCRCPANKVWRNNGCFTCEELYGPGYTPDSTQESGCSRCPTGSTWDQEHSLCVCDNGYGPYEGTNSCTVNLCSAPGAFYTPEAGATNCGCLPNDTYYRTDLSCCYCPAQAGVGHDAQHDSRGCYIGS